MYCMHNGIQRHTSKNLLCHILTVRLWDTAVIQYGYQAFHVRGHLKESSNPNLTLLLWANGSPLWSVSSAATPSWNKYSLCAKDNCGRFQAWTYRCPLWHLFFFLADLWFLFDCEINPVHTEAGLWAISLS